MRVSVLPELKALAALHASAFGYTAEPADASGWKRVLARSLCWVTAHQGERLVGFVNVAWDGGVHTFLLDTVVAPDCARQGIGTRLVMQAAEEAARLGAGWLHVDYEPHLEAFYHGCGFAPTDAGLLRLR